MTGRLRGALAISIAALALSAAPGAWAATLDAGDLRVSVERDPFAIEFRDRESGEVLRTLGGGAPAPEDPSARYGPLGFSFDLRVPILGNAYLGYYVAAEVPTVWFHATRVEGLERARGGRSLTITAATNDPLGHELEIVVERIAGGVARVSSRPVGPLAGGASLSGAAFEAAEGDHYLGLGSRSNAADQAGNEVFNWAEEGPFSSGEAEEIFRPLLPDFTFPTGPTATNFPVPWVVLDRGLGFLIDRDERSRFRFASDRPDAWQAEAEADEFAFIVVAGPRPADVVRRYSALTGRQPNPLPWIFGPWFQATLEERPYELLDLWRDQDVPVTVAQTYTHFLPCGAHVGLLDDQRERVREHHRRGYKITTYFNPHVCTTYQPLYNELAAESLFVESGLGEPYLLSNPFTADELTSEFDFTNPLARERFGGLLDEAIDVGYDGWMEDFGEYTPTDSYFDNGLTGLAMHNRYPVLYHGASYRHTRERMGRDAAVFVRSGWHGSQPVSRIVWGGDPTEDWSCADGLCAAVHQALSMGMSGFAYWGSDIGGFHAVVNPRTDDELNIRWLQFGMVSGVMRTQANGFSFQDDRAERSQVWHEKVLPIWRRYTKLRTQLLPYIEVASSVYQRTGMPLTRHLALAFPGDAAASTSEEEFMFGPDLFVAPVIEPGARERSFHLPRGRWVDFWRSVSYRPGSGAFVPRGAELLRGGRELTLPAPLAQMPLLVRAGAILPMLSPDVDTLANLGEGKRLVTLGERRDRMKLMAFPRGRSSSLIGRGERVVSREGDRRWRLTIDGRRERRYTLEASLGSLRRPFEVCELRIDGSALPPSAWSYWAAAGVLRARIRATRATVTALGSC